MKIWCQSASALGTDPVLKPYEKTLQRYIQETARLGTTVDLRGVRVWSPSVNWLRYAEYLNSSEIINNALEAERKGYDAFVVLCMDDPAFYELRQTVNIPVVSSGETAFHMACLLAPKFAILSYNAAPLEHQMENARRYGLGGRLVPGAAFGITLSEVVQSFEKPEQILKGVREVSKRASEQGAAILVPSCGMLNMILLENKIREVEGLPVLDTVGTAIKMAEFLVDLKALGTMRSNLGSYTRVAADELAALRKAYGVK
jgi:Asp/Glu/hydantoin racemase